MMESEIFSLKIAQTLDPVYFEACSIPYSDQNDERAYTIDQHSDLGG